MRGAVELSNVHNIVLVLQHSRFVVVDIEVVGSAEDCHHTRESSRPRLPVHAISSILRFVCSDDGEEVVLFEEIACSWIGEEVRTSSNVVVNVELSSLLLSEFFQWVSPENVAHQAVSRRFSESINLSMSVCVIAPSKLTYTFDVLQGM